MADSNEPIPYLAHSEPILFVHDVVATIKFWQDVLAFPNQWVWGDPPTHGGVSWNVAALQFSLNPEGAKRSAGNYVWIRVKYIDQLYKLHKERGVTIEEAYGLRPWGMWEYTVKDNNGYLIRFAGHSAAREKSGEFPHHVKIIERNPTKEEFIALQNSVGWYNSTNRAYVEQHVSAPVYSALAIDTHTNEVIGCALLISDNASFYYLKDVMVKEEWQRKRIGTALMKSVMSWLEKNGIKQSLVGLYTGENLEPFYTQFGFGKGFGMVKTI